MTDAALLFQEEEHRSQSLDLALWRKLWGYARRYRRVLTGLSHRREAGWEGVEAALSAQSQLPGARAA